MEERFRRTAGHDLRNLPRLILMAGKLARRHLGVGAKTDLTKYLENIGEPAAQMRRIIETFLEIRAPTAAGNPAGSSGRVDLNRLCAAVVRPRTHVADRKQITLVTEPAGALLRARCDVALAYPAFTNFTSNALKFRLRGGRVTIATSFAGGRGRVEVRDPGPVDRSANGGCSSSNTPD